MITLQQYISQHPDRPLYLRIKVSPKSRETKVTEITSDETHGDTIKIRLKAAPEKGKANDELIKFLAQELNINKNHISIISGHSDRLKLIKISAPSND